jgi:lysophospholipase L1-like esterase
LLGQVFLLKISDLKSKISALILFFAVLLSASPTQAKTIHVFLIGGQSNAVGQAYAADVPTQSYQSPLPAALQSPQEDVLYYSKETKDQGLITLRPFVAIANYGEGKMFGPEITFGRSMADFYAASGQKVALLKYAVNATDLATEWAAPHGPRYLEFKNLVSAGMAELAKACPGDKLVLTGMIWMQGENDAAETAKSLAYQTNLSAFIQDIRASYGENLPFVLGRLSVNQLVEPGGFGITNKEGLNQVRDAQKKVGEADAFTAWVDTDSFTTWFHPADKYHFDAKGQIELGNAFAVKMQGLLVPTN